MILRSFLPYQDELPIVLNFSHSGNIIPGKIKVTEMDLEGESSLDIFLNGSSYGASVFRAIYSKHWVDLCESPTIVEGRKIECDAIPLRTTLEKSLNRDIQKNHKALAKRINNFHRPYFDKIEERIADLKQRHSNVLLIDLHVLDAKSSASQFGVSLFKDTQINKDVYDTIISVLRDSEELSLSRKEVSAGPYVLDRFGKSTDGVHAIQLAFSKTLLNRTEIVNDFGEVRLQRILREVAFLMTGALKTLS